MDLPDVAPAPVTDYQSLDAAEQAIHERIALLLPVRHWDAIPGHHVIAATMGVGKTAAVLDRLNRLLNGLDNGSAWPMAPTATGERPIRILYLCDTTDQLREKSTKYLSARWAEDLRIISGVTERRWVWKQRMGDRFHIMEGRNPFSQSASYCENPRAAEVGARRHLAALETCNNKEHPCAFHMDCVIKGYLANKETVRTARFVMATKASYLNGSDEIGDFDCIIFDEDVTAHLLETVQVTREDVSQWRVFLNERDPSGEYNLLDECLAWWEAAAAHAAAHATKGRESRALDVLRATAPENAITLLQAARGSCRETVKSTPRAICETPIPHAPVPLRAIYDLAGEMLTEWQRPTEADSRLRYSAGGILALRMPRLATLAHLAAKQVIYLDATAHEPTMRRLLALSGQAVPLTLHRFEVAMPVEVITVTDSLFSRDTLARADGAARRAITETLVAIAADRCVEPAQVAALTFKTFNPANQTEGGADLPLSTFSCGHWGKDDKATDRFADCQILATIGNYTPNIGVLEATVEALRFAECPPRATEAFRRVIAYPGTSRGIERECHPDPEVQEAIDHATWMHETQALGRLRAVRRDGPFLWVRFNNAPYHDLVSELVTLDELRVRYGLTPLQVDSPKREALRRKNEERQRRARVQCLMTWQRLIREGTPEGDITLSQLCRESGVRRDTARIWLASQQPTVGISEGSTTDGFNISIPVRRTTLRYPAGYAQDDRREAPSRPMENPSLVPHWALATQNERHGLSQDETERRSWRESLVYAGAG